MNWSALSATGSIIACGITFPGNATGFPDTRFICPFTKLYCWKIVLGPTDVRLKRAATSVGSHPLLVRMRLLKSPCRIASVGRSVSCTRKSWRYRGSPPKKKNVLLRPS